MRVLAGTSKGVFALYDGAGRCQLESGPVRDLISHEGRLFAGTSDGLFVSDDTGDTWESAGLDGLEVWQVRAASDGTLYAATQPARLFRSADRGRSWGEMTSFAAQPQAERWCVPIDPPLPGRARALVVDQTDASRLWVGVEVGGIARTCDSGESWTFGLPGDNPDLHMMCAHPEDPDLLFASTGYGRLDGVADMVEGNAGVFRSEDGGVSWVYAWHGITPRYSRPMCIDPRPPYGLTVASAPTAFSSHRDEGGAKAMLFRSDDGGRTWRSLCDGAHTPAKENVHGLAPCPEHAGAVLIGTDTGEVWRVSAEAIWEPLGAGLPSVLSIAAL